MEHRTTAAIAVDALLVTIVAACSDVSARTEGPDPAFVVPMELTWA